MLVLIIFARQPRADNKALMRQSAVVSFKLLLRNEGNRCVIIGKIIGHRLDFTLNFFFVCARLGNNKTFSCVLHSRGQLGVFTVSDSFESFGNGNSILPCVRNAVNSSDGVGMSLADALSPEGIAFAVGEDCIGIKMIERKQTRVPADGNNGGFARRFCGAVNIFEMLRDAGVSVETVNNIEYARNFGSLNGQVGCASAAHYHNINAVFIIFNLPCADNGSAFKNRFNLRRLSAGENGGNGHIRILTHGALNASAYISVSVNSYSDNN